MNCSSSILICNHYPLQNTFILCLLTLQYFNISNIWQQMPDLCIKQLIYMQTNLKDLEEDHRITFLTSYTDI